METLDRHIVVVANTGWSIVRYRGVMICRLISQGWRVTAVANFDDRSARQVHEWGAEGIHVPMEGATKNPIKDVGYLLKVFRLYRDLKPDLVHHFTVKPVIYGSIAAKFAKISSIVNTITGFGGLFANEKPTLRRLILRLYRAALRGNVRTVFQNPDDMNKFISLGIVPEKRALVIAGSGVDTRALTPEDTENRAASNAFVLVSRMLWSKGIQQFVEAARLVKSHYPDARFIMIGGAVEDYGSKNSDFVPTKWLNDLNKEGVVEWIGWQDPCEVESWMKRSAAVILPSCYGEGVPRTLIEAAACGTPIITTDIPGCRDIVIDGVTGYLCAPRSVSDLASAMERILGDPESVLELGFAGRKLAVEKFDERIIFSKMMQVYEAALPGIGPAE